MDIIKNRIAQKALFYQAGPIRVQYVKLSKTMTMFTYNRKYTHKLLVNKKGMA